MSFDWPWTDESTFNWITEEHSSTYINLHFCSYYFSHRGYTYFFLVSVHRSFSKIPQESGEWIITILWEQGRRNRGCGGTMPPTFGTSEVQGAVQWKWSLLLQQTVFIQYCTSDWISTPLTLVDTCQVNDIWKDAWVVFPRSTLTGLLHYSYLHAKSDRALYKVWRIAANTVSYHDS